MLKSKNLKRPDIIKVETWEKAEEGTLGEIHIQSKVPRFLPILPIHTETDLVSGDILQDRVWRPSDSCILNHCPPLPCKTPRYWIQKGNGRILPWGNDEPQRKGLQTLTFGF